MLIALALAAAATPSKPATAAPSPEQVADAVDTTFPTYDLDGDGQLSRAEFATMMTRLKARGTARAPATRAWVQDAFASADKDRSRSVNRQELTGFLNAARS